VIVKVGIQLPEAERVVRWPEYVAMARRAEELGFASLWVGDHLLYRNPGEPPKGPWEAWTLLSALAAATNRIQLGPLVACTSFHNPAVLAKMATTVDEISGGRLILGLGAGWNAAEYEAFGLAYDHRVDRFAESFTIIRTLLRDGVADVAGLYVQARDCVIHPSGPREHGPPLLIGSSGLRMLRLTVPYVTAWNAWYRDFGNRPEGIQPLRERVDAACRDAGRDPASLERTVALFVATNRAAGRAGGDLEDRAVAPLDGSPERLTASLRAFEREGISHVQLVLDPIDLQAIESIAPVLELLDRDEGG
jgi:alkanesulfonate monooxygenase SsuD/methylene tetrahydromethanopterin reductase-like flavin-dependent oxidoreductase (luciferase family)